jgi:hypothetical protein
MKMELICSSKMSVLTGTTQHRHIPEVSIQHRVRVFENGLLRRIRGPKRDDMTGGWRKLHKEEMHDLYPSPSIIRIIEEDEVSSACSVNGIEVVCV